ncbi:MAG: hypothetical protein ACFCUS_05650 [Rubrimonas sp.]|uniref:hypothetical protein n=1 Tax=Rubrimonas sp. TaxID=2036015 RepID=UPI002FDE1CFF
MFHKAIPLCAAALALLGCATAPRPAIAQDVPNVLVMVEDSDRDTVPRDSRIHRNVLAGMNDRMNGRGYRVFDEQAVGISGYQEMTASDRVRRTDQELIIVANSVARPPIDVLIAYEAFASTDAKEFATYARMRLAGRALDPRSGRFLGSFEVISPKTYTLPVGCSRECLLENLSEEGRDMGIELADVLADKLDQFFVPAAASPAANQQPVGDGGGAAPVAGGGGGFERTYTLAFSECSPATRSDFEPYLVIFEGYIDHRPNACRSTSCEMTYVSSINPGKLQRNLEKMLEHSNHPGRVTVDGLTYAVTCVPQRKATPTQTLNANDW